MPNTPTLKSKIDELLEAAEKATPRPWRVGYESMRVEAGSMNICDIRGWGHLTGKGALGLPEEEAIAIQDANCRLITLSANLAPQMAREIKNMMEALGNECHVTDHRLGGIDDCPPCQALARAKKELGCG